MMHCTGLQLSIPMKHSCSHCVMPRYSVANCFDSLIRGQLCMGYITKDLFSI